jgi:hypothetical protein
VELQGVVQWSAGQEGLSRGYRVCGNVFGMGW